MNLRVSAGRASFASAFSSRLDTILPAFQIVLVRDSRSVGEHASRYG